MCVINAIRTTGLSWGQLCGRQRDREWTKKTVMDAEIAHNVHKGITQWVGVPMRVHQSSLTFVWVPLHVGIIGNGPRQKRAACRTRAICSKYAERQQEAVPLAELLARRFRGNI